MKTSKRCVPTSKPYSGIAGKSDSIVSMSTGRMRAAVQNCSQGAGMSGRLRLVLSAVMAVVCALHCSKKEQRETVVVHVRCDSLTMSDVRSLVPSIQNDSTRIAQATLRATLAGGKRPKAAAADTLSVKLSQKLSMLSGEEWSPGAAASLLSASRELMKISQQVGSRNSLSKHLDSLLKANTSIEGALKHAVPLVTDTAGSAVLKFDDREGMAKLLQVVFSLPENEALVVSEFLEAGGTREMNDVTKLVQGLVFDEKAQKNKAVTTKQLQHDNSMIALKYRDRQSIMDSIGGHTLHLQHLYKKHLKTNPEMDGTVQILFRVGVKGNVIGASIKQSQIDNREFLDLLLAYVKTIRFKQVPEKVGPMTFEFPFEFNPEM
jgi:hypothetical protein